MPIRFRSFELWLYTLVGGFISGGATAGLMKLTMPNTIIDWSDFWHAWLASGLVSILPLLKQSPLPPLSTGETEIITPPKP